MLTKERLKEVLEYSTNTGLFTWKVTLSKRAVSGSIAGYKSEKGYIYIRLDGILYPSHRLVWMYVYGYFPPDQIDHINHDKGDNRVLNLRAVTNGENHRNMGMRTDNTSGYTGIYFDKSRCRWYAEIVSSGKKQYLGSSKDIVDCIGMRISAEERLGFHVNHGKSC